MKVVPALAALAFAVAVGCGGYQPTPLGACDGIPEDDAECDSSHFVAADKCFPNLQAACDCLACPKNRCVAAESAPAQVTCGAAKPEPGTE